MPKDRIVERSVTLQRINFLKGQIDDLDGYFPDTYQFLIDKIDAQKRILAEIDLAIFDEEIEDSRIGVDNGI
jgi:hypothetical protein